MDFPTLSNTSTNEIPILSSEAWERYHEDLTHQYYCACSTPRDVEVRHVVPFVLLRIIPFHCLQNVVVFGDSYRDCTVVKRLSEVADRYKSWQVLSKSVNTKIWVLGSVIATGYNSLHVRESGFRNPEVQCLESEIHSVNSVSQTVFDSFTWGDTMSLCVNWSRKLVITKG